MLIYIVRKSAMLTVRWLSPVKHGDCCGEASSCCGVSDDAQINQLISTRLGYRNSDLDLCRKVPIWGWVR